ncbi:DUF6804 family protein [Rathayibacter toxicus]|nr:DUF6804 family protein [Rathayibacter toxicus]PPG20375.1 hypothetical protein C5D15_07570 [Rathayibacter toxicus]PPG45476.1 hypothetical protein C5D16_07535 [Rathayibacter toxicus]PPI22037.1 hypothetical protein C5D55_07575 [Rathayibacter toxicus]PPI43895.1 hypothetical protein C5D43_07530 [Rathayibacter toxicus]PPI48509.1 hypothetical protein C5C66_07570 [Rathayibacter toxicus]
MSTSDARRAGDRSASQPGARMALAPGILTAIILLAGLPLVGGSSSDLIRYPVAILTAVMCWFVIRARAFLWLIALVPLVVLWNPVVPLSFPDAVWSSLHIAAVGVVCSVGMIVRVPSRD